MTQIFSTPVPKECTLNDPKTWNLHNCLGPCKPNTVICRIYFWVIKTVSPFFSIFMSKWLGFINLTTSISESVRRHCGFDKHRKKIFQPGNFLPKSFCSLYCLYSEKIHLYTKLLYVDQKKKTKLLYVFHTIYFVYLSHGKTTSKLAFHLWTNIIQFAARNYRGFWLYYATKVMQRNHKTVTLIPNPQLKSWPLHYKMEQKIPWSPIQKTQSIANQRKTHTNIRQ